eukprot:CAMPEP_0179138376 /NCGR_PEP_ID=MMETSP0796-20121207/66091_1 /TAXON_ID=73915 /ORGANISM="Pyrodinium bahamense, Strain pbaha01" /LENGTH=74 /DNA_ID=CAMNT_0020837671 /DNA_START=64 /DNA_END=284 /DNA_ORIENTATION=-
MNSKSGVAAFLARRRSSSASLWTLRYPPLPVRLKAASCPRAFAMSLLGAAASTAEARGSGEVATLGVRSRTDVA